MSLNTIIIRSSWWPAGALSEMDAFTLSVLTNDEVLRVGMLGERPRQVLCNNNRFWNATAVVWTSDDSLQRGT